MRVLIATVLLGALALAAVDPRIAHFKERVDQYAALRTAAARKVPGLPKAATPEQIEKYEQALAVEIRNTRAGAKQGDVFTPEIQPVILQIIKDNLHGATHAEARATARQGNPEVEKTPGETTPAIEVNAVYPRNAPVSSVPPYLLLQLPKLPKDVQYRFSGQTLILADTLSGVIIDYMKGAAPGL
jgi:hypothetical protein